MQGGSRNSANARVNDHVHASDKKLESPFYVKRELQYPQKDPGSCHLTSAVMLYQPYRTPLKVQCTRLPTTARPGSAGTLGGVHTALKRFKWPPEAAKRSYQVGKRFTWPLEAAKRTDDDEVRTHAPKDHGIGLCNLNVAD